MFLGRVVGCVWSTVKAPGLDGQRLLIVQPLTPETKKTGKRIICTDATGAGAEVTMGRGVAALHAEVAELADALA